MMIRKIALMVAGLSVVLSGVSCSTTQAAGRVVGYDKHGMPGYSDKVKKRKVRTTAYHAKEWDHKKYKSKSAAGTPLKYGEVRSAAADWSRYPLGTKFKIDGLPFTYVVDDYGSALVGTNTIDLFKRSDKEMRWWGVRKVDIKILEWGDFEKSEEILSGRRKYRHCRQMHDALKKRLSSASRLPTDA